jgi:hypothetical protein
VSSFQPGDVVICVDGRPGGNPANWHPKRGDYYRIEAMGKARWGVWVDLAEDPSARDEWGWDARRFRKIDDEVSDAFRETLRRIKSRAPAQVCRDHFELLCILCQADTLDHSNTPADIPPTGGTRALSSHSFARVLNSERRS